MRKAIAGVFILLLMAGCSGRKSKAEEEAELMALVDSALVQDSIEALEEEASSVPSRADELFDDFMFHFASEPRFQLRRIAFPLKVYEGGRMATVQKEEWIHDHLFTLQTFYTLIFDDENDMEMDKDTTVNSVQIEWRYMAEHAQKIYEFRRIHGAWMLVDVRKNKEEFPKEESFTEFFYKFANDSLYQREHIAEPLKFITTDPDDEFSVLETTMDRDQWFAFRPMLPKDTLTNINYGQKYNRKSVRILSLKGIANGFSNTLYFKFLSGKWKLVAFEDMSD